jgi:hypothetical protein
MVPLDQARSKVMAQIMPAEAPDLRALQEVRPRGLDSRRDVKDTVFIARLLAPAFEHTQCLLIQGDMTGLASLRVHTFDREKLASKVDAGPAQFEELTAAKSGVHRQEHGRRQVILEVGQGRKYVSVADSPPGVRRLAPCPFRRRGMQGVSKA